MRSPDIEQHINRNFAAAFDRMAPGLGMMKIRAGTCLVITQLRCRTDIILKIAVHTIDFVYEKVEFFHDVLVPRFDGSFFEFFNDVSLAFRIFFQRVDFPLVFRVFGRFGDCGFPEIGAAFYGVRDGHGVHDRVEGVECSFPTEARHDFLEHVFRVFL